MSASLNPASAVRRRDFLAGGLAGLVGGAACNRAADKPADANPPGPTPDPAKPGTDLTPERLHPDLPNGVRVSYAQFGEDLVLFSLLVMLKIEKPTFLDIGAYDPVISNNTYFLYHYMGGRGVLIEPNPDFVPAYQKWRPEDKFLSAGIGITDDPSADYHMFEDAQANTFDPQQKDKLVKAGKKFLRTVKVPLVNINRAIAEQLGGKTPDVLSIDIEGLDFEVLKTLDWKKYRPKIVCAETLITLTKQHRKETTALMEGLGYEVRGMTFPNTLYVDKALLVG